MIEHIPKSKLLDLLSRAVNTTGAEGVSAVVVASGLLSFNPRLTSTSELLEIYDRRLRMGRLDSVTGGREFVEALRSLQDAEVLMVVVESSAGSASVWVSGDLDSVVGALSFAASPE